MQSGELDEWSSEMILQRTDWYTLDFCMRVLYGKVVRREHAMKGHNNPLDLDGESVMLVACSITMSDAPWHMPEVTGLSPHNRQHMTAKSNE